MTSLNTLHYIWLCLMALIHVSLFSNGRKLYNKGEGIVSK